MNHDKFSLWELVLEPQETSIIHTHQSDYSFYISKGSDLAIYDINDKKVAEFACKSGDYYSFKLDKKTNTLIADHNPKIKIPATHKAQNIGNKRFEEILIEMKK